jgi:hypothetical protein
MSVALEHLSKKPVGKEIGAVACSTSDMLRSIRANSCSKPIWRLSLA